MGNNQMQNMPAMDFKVGAKGPGGGVCNDFFNRGVCERVKCKFSHSLPNSQV